MKGAWIAGFQAAEFLEGKKLKRGMPKELAARLIAVLLSKEEIPSTEYSREGKKAPKEVVSLLAEKLSKEHEFWMVQEGISNRDPAPLREEESAFSEWYARHGGLKTYLGMSGCEGLGSMAVSRIPKEILGVFWGS